MSMSKYNRSKLKAHDHGENRHHKGLMFLMKQARLKSKHQAALQLAAERRRRAAQQQQQECPKSKTRKRHVATQAASEIQLVPVSSPVEVGPGRRFRIRRVDNVEEPKVHEIKVVMPMKLNW